MFGLNLDPADAKVAVCEALRLREDLLAEYLVGERDVIIRHPIEGVHVALVEIVQRLVDTEDWTLKILTPTRSQQSSTGIIIAVS